MKFDVSSIPRARPIQFPKSFHLQVKTVTEIQSLVRIQNQNQNVIRNHIKFEIQIIIEFKFLIKLKCESDSQIKPLFKNQESQVPNCRADSKSSSNPASNPNAIAIYCANSNSKSSSDSDRYSNWILIQFEIISITVPTTVQRENVCFHKLYEVKLRSNMLS